MASKREGQHTIRIDMASTGVNTAQARAISPENTLWECENMGVDFRGALKKHPKVEQIGEAIMEPTNTNSANHEMVSLVLPVNGEDWRREGVSSLRTNISSMRNGALGVSILSPIAGVEQFNMSRPVY